MRNITLVVALVISLVGCTPEDGISVREILSSETWVEHTDLDYKLKIVFHEDESGRFRAYTLVYNEGCHFENAICNSLRTEVYQDRVIEYFKQGCGDEYDDSVYHIITYTIEDGVLKMEGERFGVSYFSPNSDICIR
jgi:hypothetical protein